MLALHAAGHEVGAHTVNHAGLRWFEPEGLQTEVRDSRKAIIDCGIPEKEVAGFRCPYLADKPDVRKALVKYGFR